MTAASEKSPVRSKGHPRFVVLDGVRGVAAMVVMLGHLMQYTGCKLGFAFGFTAVDLFFILSGFVVAFAYQGRIDGGLGFGQFVRLRLIRLYPLYLIGLLIGIISYLPVGPRFHSSPLPLATLSVLGLLFLPYFSRTISPFDLRGSRIPIGLFPLNGPAWSLLDEILINILFGFMAVKRLRFAWVLYIALATIVLFKLIGTSTGGFGVLNGGWGDDNAWVGVIRVIYGFPLGVMLYRMYAKTRRPGFSIPGWPIIAAAALAMVMPPHFGESGRLLHHIQTNYSYILSLVVWPAVVWLGACATLGATASRFFGWLGGISYALYAVHFPLFHICCQFGNPASPITVGIAVALSLALAHFLTRYIDPALRDLLGKVRFKKMAPAFVAASKAP